MPECWWHTACPTAFVGVRVHTYTQFEDCAKCYTLKIDDTTTITITIIAINTTRMKMNATIINLSDRNILVFFFAFFLRFRLLVRFFSLFISVHFEATNKNDDDDGNLACLTLSLLLYVFLVKFCCCFLHWLDARMKAHNARLLLLNVSLSIFFSLFHSYAILNLINVIMWAIW